MNELEFRRRLLSDPNDSAEDFLRYQREHPACSAELERIRQLDEQILNTLQVEPPAGLQSRILLRQSFQRRAPRRLALAASVLLGVGVAGWLGVSAWRHFDPGHLNLQANVLDLADNALLSVSTERVIAHDQVRMLLGNLGAYLSHELGPVYYAKKCQIRNRDAVHLVLAGEKGPVTVFLLPAESITKTVTMDSGQLQGMIVPAQHGAMVIIGEQDESLERTAHRVGRSLEWL